MIRTEYVNVHASFYKAQLTAYMQEMLQTKEKTY